MQHKTKPNNIERLCKWCEATLTPKKKKFCKDKCRKLWEFHNTHA